MDVASHIQAPRQRAGRIKFPETGPTGQALRQPSGILQDSPSDLIQLEALSLVMDVTSPPGKHSYRVLSGFAMETFTQSRRTFLTTLAALLLDSWSLSRGFASVDHPADLSLQDQSKVIVVLCGGIRREDTFAKEGLANIPHLCTDLLPKSILYPFVHNAGVTSHFNTISSILTGTWQRLDDWGKTAPNTPTLFEYLRKERQWSEDRTWFISSNKALTNRIGASSVRDFGPGYGANVMFPKQLLIDAVVYAASKGKASRSADPYKMQPELAAMLEANNYEGLGWSVSGESSILNASARATVSQAIQDLLHANAPITGDEFTFLVGTEVMRRFAPSLLVLTFSDMEVAHFGSYSMHLAGIRTVDRLVYELWNQVEANPAYKGKTTLFVLPEFGRDLDGSVTNGFFNHREDCDSTRLTWMICTGEGVKPGDLSERVVQSIDICPTILHLFGLDPAQVAGKALSEMQV